MAGNDTAGEKLCEEKHKNIDRQLGVGEKRMNNHSDSLHDVKEAIVRLTTIQEMQMTAQVAQTKLLEGIDRRVCDLEDAGIAHKKVMEQIKADEPAPKFWEGETGRWVIKAGTYLLAAVVMAALGQSVGPEIIAWITGK